VNGRLLVVDQHEREWSNWLESEYLRPESDGMPGANGIKLNRDLVWVSVTDRNALVRVRVEPDGRAGDLELAVEELRADDFAFSEAERMYITTHVAQSVLRLEADGTRATIAGPDEGVVGSTACAFGRAPQDGHALYVTTNGGLSLPYEGKLQDAKLVRLEVGENGAALPSG